MKTRHLLMTAILTATFAVGNASASDYYLPAGIGPGTCGDGDAADELDCLLGAPGVPAMPDPCKLVAPTAAPETAYAPSCLPTPCLNCPDPPILPEVGPCPMGQVGVVVNENPLCFPVPPVPTARLCNSSEGVGVVVSGQPVCIRASTTQCPSGQVGVTVNGIPVCVSTEGVPDPELCGSGTYGVKPYCTPVPQACPAGSYGVRPDCHTAGVCTTGYGVRVDATAVCTPTFQMCPTSWSVQPYCCASGEFGFRMGTSGGVCQRYPQGMQDVCQRIGVICAPPPPVCAPLTNVCVPPR